MRMDDPELLDLAIQEGQGAMLLAANGFGPPFIALIGGHRFPTRFPELVPDSKPCQAVDFRIENKLKQSLHPP